MLGLQVGLTCTYFYFLLMLLLQRKMIPKKGRRVRKIKIPTDKPIEFELGDMAAHIQKRREEKEARERKRHRNREGKAGGAFIALNLLVQKDSKAQQNHKSSHPNFNIQRQKRRQAPRRMLG